MGYKIHEQWDRPITSEFKKAFIEGKLPPVEVIQLPDGTYKLASFDGFTRLKLAEKLGRNVNVKVVTPEISTYLPFNNGKVMEVKK